MKALVLAKKPRLDWRTMLMVAVVANIACRIALMPYGIYEWKWRLLFNLAFVGLTGPVLCMTNASKEPGMRILLAAFGWMLFVCLLYSPRYRGSETILLSYLQLAIVTMLLMYPAAFVLGEARGRRLFTLAASVCIAGIAILAGIMLVASFCGVLVPSPSGGAYAGAGVDLYYRRLSMFCNINTSAACCAIALLLVLLVWQGARGKVTRACLILAAAILFCALALSDARTPSWTFCICVGGAAYLAVAMRLNGKTKRELLRVGISIGVALAAAVICFLAMRLLARLLNPMLPSLKEVRSPTYKVQTLTGRSIVWEAGFRAFKDNPVLCITGAGPYQGMPYVTPYFPLDQNTSGLTHMHNILLQTAITFGLPGVALFTAFAGYVIVHAVRLFFLGGARCSYFERALPLLLAFVLIADLVECFLSFASSLNQSNPWFFLTAGYVVYLSKTKIPAKNRRNNPA